MSYPRENAICKRATATANKAATIELEPAGSSLRYRLRRVLYGYGGAGTLAGGTLTIEDGTTPKIELPVASAGSSWLPLDWQAQPDATVKVSLTAGGSEVTAAIALIYTVE